MNNDYVIETGPVAVDTPHGRVYIKRAMWDDYMFITQGGDDDNEGQVAARMVVACVCRDETGAPSYQRDEVQSVLNTVPLGALLELGKAVREHCGAFLTANESAEGNSPTTRPSDSGTG